MNQVSTIQTFIITFEGKVDAQNLKKKRSKWKGTKEAL